MAIQRRGFLEGTGLPAATGLVDGVSAQPTRQPPADYTCDAAVMGGGPAGTCAAIAAARNGAKVMLAEHGDA